MRKIAFIALIGIALMGFASCGGNEEPPVKNYYTVTFDADGGTPVPEAQRVEEGKTATAPATHPAKQGYVFEYWSADGTNAYNFQTPVTKNLTLRAKWQKEAVAEYWQVTWELNGGAWPAEGDNHASQVLKGGTLAEPAAPAKSGHTFDGWYKEAALTNKVTFPYDVSTATADFTLYAKWTAEGGGDIANRKQGLYIGNSTAPVNLDNYSGNLMAKAIQYYSANPPAEYTLVLEEDFVKDKDLNFKNPDSKLTIIGKGGIRTITGSSNDPADPIFIIWSGNTITFGENINLAGNTRALDIRGTVIMKAGSSIKVRAKSRNAVIVKNKFIMEGGIIEGNSNTNKDGGGVMVDRKGDFIMEDGVIEGNISSTFGGGVYVAEEGKFTMKGGTIKNNYAGVGGGVCIWGGSFIMEGGVISGNRALNGSAHGVSISGGGNGGGVCVGKGEFIMKKGTIYGANDPSMTNHAKRGEALYRNDGTVTYGDGTSILPAQGNEYNNTLTGRSN